MSDGSFRLDGALRLPSSRGRLCAATALRATKPSAARRAGAPATTVGAWKGSPEARSGVRLAARVRVTGDERRRRAGALVEGVARRAAGVVGEQVDRDRGLLRGRAHAVHV